MQQDRRHVPDWLLERLALGELDAETAADVRRRLEAEGRTPDEIAALAAASNRAILEQPPATPPAAATGPPLPPRALRPRPPHPCGRARTARPPPGPGSSPPAGARPAGRHIRPRSSRGNGGWARGLPAIRASRSCPRSGSSR